MDAVGLIEVTPSNDLIVLKIECLLIERVLGSRPGDCAWIIQSGLGNGGPDLSSQSQYETVGHFYDGGGLGWLPESIGATVSA